MSGAIPTTNALTTPTSTLAPLKLKNLIGSLQSQDFKISILSFLTFQELLSLLKVNETSSKLIAFKVLAEHPLLHRLMEPWHQHTLLSNKPSDLHAIASSELLSASRKETLSRLNIAAGSPVCTLVCDQLFSERRGMTHFISSSTRTPFQGPIIASNNTLALSLSAQPVSEFVQTLNDSPDIVLYDLVKGTSESLELDREEQTVEELAGLNGALHSHYLLYAKHGFIIEDKGENGETIGKKIITIHSADHGNWICCFKITDSAQSEQLMELVQDLNESSTQDDRAYIEELRKSKWLKLTEIEKLPIGSIEAAYHQMMSDKDVVTLKIGKSLFQIVANPLSRVYATRLPENCFEMTANRKHLFFLKQSESESKEGATLCMQSPDRIEKDAKSTIPIPGSGKIQRACMKANEHFLALLYSRTQADQKGTCALQVFSLDGNVIKPIFDKPREFVGRFNDFELHLSDHTLALQTQSDTHFYYIDRQCATRVAIHKDVCTMDIHTISEKEMRLIRMGQRGCDVLSFERNPQTNGKADSSTDKKDDAPKPDKKESSSCVVS